MVKENTRLKKIPQLKKRKKLTKFDVVDIVILSILFLITLYPLYFIVIASISAPAAVNSGQVLFLPKKLNLDGYKFVLKSGEIWSGYANTVILTLVGTVINLSLTMMGAYALSKSHLPFIRPIMFLFTFTMFFSGGMVPTYLLVSNTLHLRNTMWSMILPGAVSVYNLILVRTYYKTSIQDEIIQAAKIDGCSEFRSFISVVLPLSKPIIATMALFYGVGHWNQFFQALIYISDSSKFPLQLVLRNLLLQGNTAMTSMISGAMSGENAKYVAEMMQRAEILKYAVIIISTLPVLVIYPFLQKYFVKGIMAGSLKG